MGASTTQNVAKEMLRQGRAPRNKSEQMIFNSYQAMHFLIHHLDVMRNAITALHEFLRNKVCNINEAEQRLTQNARLKDRLNFRQLALLRHALKHPRFAYVIEEHQRSHGVSYDVARKDLLFMASELKLLTKTKEGKRYLFVVPEDLEQRLRK